MESAEKLSGAEKQMTEKQQHLDELVSTTTGKQCVQIGLRDPRC